VARPREHLRNAPIAEAVIDFRVVRQEQVSAEAFADLGSSIVEAFRLWEIYVDAAKPRQVSRVAVRYINQMQLPAVKDLGEYLTAPPQLPEPIPQTVRDFLTRVNVRDDRRNASAVIVQALEPQIDPKTISLLLDIDAFREMNEKSDDPGLVLVFEHLRELKNDIFFASITEKIVEKYA